MRYNPFKHSPDKPVRPEPLAKGTIPTPAIADKVVLKENEEHDGFELHFNGKPNADHLARLRATRDGAGAHRWHYHFRGKFWFAKRNDINREFALAITGTPAPVAAEPEQEDEEIALHHAEQDAEAQPTNIYNLTQAIGPMSNEQIAEHHINASTTQAAILTAFTAGGRGAVLPTTDEQEAIVKELTQPTNIVPVDFKPVEPSAPVLVQPQPAALPTIASATAGVPAWRTRIGRRQ